MNYLGTSNEDSANIIQDLVIQESILNRFLVTNQKNVRKNAFRPTNILDKNNQNYGNPYFSLKSYFQFFEDPKDDSTKDWLYYGNIDIFSSTMKIQNDIVLVELRSFAHLLRTYMGSVADSDLLEDMTTGVCNRIRRVYKPEIRTFSIRGLNRMIQLYESGSRAGGDRRRKGRPRKTVKNLM